MEGTDREEETKEIDMKKKGRPELLAMYLPQFHETPENNLFWGEGFTDWCSVRQAESYFKGHEQPKVPLNGEYYDLSRPECIKKQAALARKYGIDGFCMYHYWFENEKKMLYKPAEILLDNQDIDIDFCFMWDNSSWIRSWSKYDGNAWAPTFEKNSNNQKGYLLKVDYGSEQQWKNHFDYLLPFFKDQRYVKIDNRPVFGFFTTKNAGILQEMGNYWDKLAIENGFQGMYLISRSDPFIPKRIFKTEFVYQPITSAWQRHDAIMKRIQRYVGTDKKQCTPKCYDYEKVWKKIILEARLNAGRHLLFCGFVNYDDTPRRGCQGKVIVGGTPERFERNFSKLYKLSKKHQKDILFLMAWNEWGEGSYLEPDQKDGYKYLEKILETVDNEQG